MEEQKLKKQNRLVLVILVLLVATGLAIHQYFNYALRPARNDPQPRGPYPTAEVPAGEPARNGGDGPDAGNQLFLND